MSSDVRNGRLSSSTLGGVYWNLPQSQDWTPDTCKIHNYHILGDEDRILHRVTEEFITFLHTPQSTLIHSFIKPPRYIQHNGMLKYSTVHRMRCNVEQYCMVQHISQKFYTRVA